MSKTSGALLTKFLLTFAASAVAFSVFDRNSLGWALAIAAAGTVLNYIIGDLGILPRAGNFVASLADGGLAALTALAIDRMSASFNTDTGSLVTFGILVGVAEYFFHNYLLRSRKVAP